MPTLPLLTIDSPWEVVKSRYANEFLIFRQQIVGYYGAEWGLKSYPNYWEAWGECCKLNSSSSDEPSK